MKWQFKPRVYCGTLLCDGAGSVGDGRDRFGTSAAPKENGILAMSFVVCACCLCGSALPRKRKSGANSSTA